MIPIADREHWFQHGPGQIRRKETRSRKVLANHRGGGPTAVTTTQPQSPRRHLTRGPPFSSHFSEMYRVLRASRSERKILSSPLKRCIGYSAALFVRFIRCEVGKHTDLKQSLLVLSRDLQAPNPVGSQTAIQIPEAFAGVARCDLPGGSTIRQMLSNIIDIFIALAVENIEKVSRHISLSHATANRSSDGAGRRSPLRWGRTNHNGHAMGSQHVGNGSTTSGGAMHRETTGMSSGATRDNRAVHPGRTQAKNAFSSHRPLSIASQPRAVSLNILLLKEWSPPCGKSRRRYRSRSAARRLRARFRFRLARSASSSSTC
jgi:hypothetical protein